MTSIFRATPADNAAGPELPSTGRASYWDEVAGEWSRRGDLGAWRTVSDAVNTDLIERGLPAAPEGRVLKTDLFDELAGEGLVGTLSESFGAVAGIDVSPTLVEVVQARNPQLDAPVADIRELPFGDGAFDAAVSNSTLDHFPSPSEDRSLGPGDPPRPPTRRRSARDARQRNEPRRRGPQCDAVALARCHRPGVEQIPLTPGGKLRMIVSTG